MNENPAAASAPAVSGQHLQRSTAAVLLNTVATGGLGAAFWLLAARLFEPTDVAAAVAASSLIIGVAFVAQLNLATSLSRFLPAFPDQQRSILSVSYRLAIGCAVVFAVAIVLVGWLRGGSIVSGGDFALTLVTAMSIPVWVVFALQDGALVAVRKAEWLPIENGLTTLAKLALLPVLLVLSTGGSAVLAAWTVPAIPAIWWVNRRLFGSLLGSGAEMEMPVRRLVGYGGVDLLGVAAIMLSLRLVPLLVVETVDGDVAAFVGVPWSILAVAALALAAVSRLMLAEMSQDPAEASTIADRTTRLVMTIFIPGSIAGAICTYPVLSLVGSDYASSGTPVLAIGLLGLVPAALVECRLARLRYSEQMSSVATRQVARALLIVVGVITALAIGRPEMIGAAFAAANVLSLGFVRVER